MPGDLVPETMRQWIRDVEAKLRALERHRHPAVTADLAELEARVAALEAAVEPLAADTGWVPLTLLNGWATSGGQTPVYRVQGVTVCVLGRVNGGVGSLVATLPEGARPLQTYDKIAWNGQVTPPAIGTIQIGATTGNIVITNMATPNLDVTFMRA